MSLGSQKRQDLLDEIFGQYNKKNYLECIETCQGLLSDYSIKSKLQSIIGLCFLCLNDIDKAEIHIEKGFKLDPYLSYCILGFAYIDLIKNRQTSALVKYTRLLNLKKEKKRTEKILKLIKKNNGISIISEKNIFFFIPDKLPLFKRIKSFPNIFSNIFTFLLKKYIWVITIICFFIFSFILYLSLFNKSNFQFESKNNPLASIYLFETNTSESKFTTKEIVNSFEMMKRYIKSRRINEAIVLYNQINDSDINLLLKEKFKILYKFIPKPTFSDFENTYILENQINNSKLINTYIKIKGIASKQKKLNGNISFNFTLTDKNKNLLHTVEVFFKNTNNLYIRRNHQYQLLAQYRGFNETTKKILLHGLILKEQK